LSGRADDRAGSWGLAQALLFIATTIAVVVGATMAWRASATFEEALTRAFASKGEAIALALASASEQNAGTNVSMVQSSVDAHKAIYAVSYIFLLDSEGRPTIHTFSPAFPAGLERHNAIALGETLPEGQRVKVAYDITFAGPNGTAHAFDVAAPIAAGALGTVHVGMNSDLIKQQLAELRGSMFLWGGGVAAGAILLALLVLVVTVIRPVQDLTRFTREVAGGQLGAAARVAGPHEVRALGLAMNRMVREIAEGRTQLAKKARLEKEMEIAARIQTSILPRKLEVRGLDLAASMVPADEVGGDYYDVLPVEDGCWIGIGDVAGHGLTAGLEMMMIQTAVAALVRADPGAKPSTIAQTVNRILYDNIRERLQRDEHATFSLLRYHSDGRIVFAGAHEEMLIVRARGGPCERIETPGTWLGAIRNIERVTVDTGLVLERGDVLVLYTDGAIEAQDAKGQPFGLDRLCDAIERARGESVQAMRDAAARAIDAWTKTQADDVTLVVVRYVGSG
jgi:serine phosphatase RsbU (regulator of sigma subunit)